MIQKRVDCFARNEMDGVWARVSLLSRTFFQSQKSACIGVYWRFGPCL
jgi:hypothetical protein